VNKIKMSKRKKRVGVTDAHVPLHVCELCRKGTIKNTKNDFHKMNKNSSFGRKPRASNKVELFIWRHMDQKIINKFTYTKNSIKQSKAYIKKIPFGWKPRASNKTHLFLWRHRS
jgi:hypothetical protein